MPGRPSRRPPPRRRRRPRRRPLRQRRPATSACRRTDRRTAATSCHVRLPEQAVRTRSWARHRSPVLSTFRPRFNRLSEYQPNSVTLSSSQTWSQSCSEPEFDPSRTILATGVSRLPVLDCGMTFHPGFGGRDSPLILFDDL